MQNLPSIIQIDDLYFSRDERAIFTGLSLSIRKGKVTAIMGPSGTGKTTLLNLIGGRLRADKGQVWVDKKEVGSLSIKELYKLRRRMGMLFQQGGLFTDLNVFENVAFPLYEHTKLNHTMIRDLVWMTLEAVGLRGASKLRIEELSGGMARRVAMARAIVLNPELMLYDEPFSGQDPIGRGVLLKLIRELNDDLGLTSVIVSHDVKETAALADYIYILAGGKVIGEGDAKWLLEDRSPEVYQFVHGVADGVVSFHYPAEPFAKELQV